MRLRIETSVSKLFEERKRHWLARGCRGTEVYRQLAADPELPTEIGEYDAAAILFVMPETMKTWRRLKKGPPYTRHPGRVSYAIATLCDLLAAAVVEVA